VTDLLNELRRGQGIDGLKVEGPETDVPLRGQKCLMLHIDADTDVDAEADAMYCLDTAAARCDLDLRDVTVKAEPAFGRRARSRP
jgi:hypothetical protein